MDIAIGIMVCLFCVFAIVARYGTLFPRFGRWLDARINRALPQLGHLFITDEEAELKKDTQT